jgi:NTE family protein
MARYALVLGGGGVTGIAWETGLIHGLREQGIDLTAADLLIGTSAGSVVSTQIATGLTPSALYARQTTPPDPALERAPAIDLSALMKVFAAQPPATGPLSPEVCARIGEMAIAAPTEPEEGRLKVINARLPIKEWPERKLQITTIDAVDGRFVVWDKDAGVPLVLAVASSCAVPMIYPPITIDGRRYIDGGIRSGTNADLASGYPLVIVIAPMAGTPATQAVLDAEAAALRAGGSRVEMIWPDDGARTAIGLNPLDPARRVSSAEAGRAQAETHVGQLRAALAGQ